MWDKKTGISVLHMEHVLFMLSVENGRFRTIQSENLGQDVDNNACVNDMVPHYPYRIDTSQYRRMMLIQVSSPVSCCC